MTSPSTWDLGRFVRTLSYFGAIPFLSSVDWFQQMLGSRPDPKADSSAIAPNTATVLVIGATNEIGQQIVKRLIAEGYGVRAIASDLPQAKLLLGQQPELVAANLTHPETLKTALNGVEAVICCAAETSELEQLIAAIAQTSTADKSIFDFTQPTTDLREIWGALDDVVMGGVSESSFRLLNSAALFSGNVSTANSGGFASVRTRNFEPPINLAEYEGIELRVKGDGNRYKFMLRSEERWDGIAYCYSFDTEADTWVNIRIPFHELVPVFRAKTVDQAGAIDSSRITAFQLMLSKFEYDGALNPKFSPGSFQLQVESIRAYGNRKLPQLILVSSTGVDEQLQDEAVIKQSQVPHTIIRPHTSTDTNERSLIVTSHTPVGKASPDDLVDACIKVVKTIAVAR